MKHALDEDRRLLAIANSDRDAFLVLAAAPGIRLAIAMFLAQQAVEKALKATQFAFGIAARRTHDLADLAVSLKDAAELPFPPEEYARLSPYAVEFRYDDSDIELMTREQAAVIVDAPLLGCKTSCGPGIREKRRKGHEHSWSRNIRA